MAEQIIKADPEVIGYWARRHDLTWEDCRSVPALSVLVLSVLVSGQEAVFFSGWARCDTELREEHAAALLQSLQEVSTPPDPWANPNWMPPKDKRNNTALQTALLLAEDIDVSLDVLNMLTDAAYKQCYEWAFKIHLRANDNDDVVVPPKPELLKRFTRPTSWETKHDST